MHNTTLMPQTEECRNCQDCPKHKQKTDSLLKKQAPYMIEKLNNAGMSIAELSRRVGVHRTLIYHWIKGYPAPKAENLIKIQCLYIERFQQKEFEFNHSYNPKPFNYYA